MPSAPPTAEELFAAAVSRRRARCACATAYTHSNLASYLSSHLPPAWRINTPSPSQVGISSFPTAHAQPAQHALELQHLAAFLGVPVAEAEDQYNGHCETCAVYFTAHVAGQAGEGEGALARAYAALTERLAQLPWEGQVGEVFAAERRAREDARLEAALQQGRTAAMWAPLLGSTSGTGSGSAAAAAASGGGSASGSGSGASASAAAAAPEGAAAAVPTAMGTVAARAFELLAGSPGFPARLAAAVAAADASGTSVLPCYILSALLRQARALCRSAATPTLTATLSSPPLAPAPCLAQTTFGTGMSSRRRTWR
jgi:hypothetical protein